MTFKNKFKTGNLRTIFVQNGDGFSASDIIVKVLDKTNLPSTDNFFIVHAMEVSTDTDEGYELNDGTNPLHGFQGRGFWGGFFEPIKFPADTDVNFEKLSGTAAEKVQVKLYYLIGGPGGD